MPTDTETKSKKHLLIPALILIVTSICSCTIATGQPIIYELAHELINRLLWVIGAMFSGLVALGVYIFNDVKKSVIDMRKDSLELKKDVAKISELVTTINTRCSIYTHTLEQ